MLKRARPAQKLQQVKNARMVSCQFKGAKSLLKEPPHNENYKETHVEVEGVRSSVNQNWKKIFVQFDVDPKDDTIDRVEFRAMMNRIEFEEDRSDYTIDSLFDALDKDGDGTITKHEFCKVAVLIQQGAHS